MGGGSSSAFGAFGDVLGSMIQADATYSAARRQADAYTEGISTQRAAAEKARREILSRMGPAMQDYASGIRSAQNEIANGTADVINILQQATGNADQILSSSGMDAQRAIMGSSASSQGVPWGTFSQQYNTMESAPPSARAAMEQQMSSVYRTGVSQALPQTAGSLGKTVAPGTTTAAAGGTVGVGVGGAVPQTGAYLTSGQTPAAAGAGTTIAPPATMQNISGGGTGFSGAMQNLQQGYATGQSALDQSIAQAREDVTGGTSAALSQLAETRAAGLGQLEPYTSAGSSAIQREAALSGALGPEAQQAAINSFIESPGQAYLRQQQEKALLRNQAAIGGLGGGNVRSALQEQAMNIAATQQQQYLENLRSLASRGQQAATTGTGLISQTGLAGAQMTQGVGQTLASLAQQYGISSADLARLTSSQMAELANSTGINLANLQQASAAARAGLQTQLGSSVAGATAGATTDIANLISQGATTQLGSQQNIATMLANLATGTGTNISNLQAAQGGALAAGQYLQGQAFAQGLQGLGQIAQDYYGQNTGNQQTTTLPATQTLNTPAGPVSTNANVTDVYF